MTHTIPTRQPTLPPVVAMPGSVDGSTLKVVRVYCPEVQTVVLIEGITYPHFTIRRTRTPGMSGLRQIREWEAIHGPSEESDDVRSCAICGAPEGSEFTSGCCTEDQMVG